MSPIGTTLNICTKEESELSIIFLDILAAHEWQNKLKLKVWIKTSVTTTVIMWSCLWSHQVLVIQIVSELMNKIISIQTGQIEFCLLLPFKKLLVYSEFISNLLISHHLNLYKTISQNRLTTSFISQSRLCFCNWKGTIFMTRQDLVCQVKLFENKRLQNPKVITKVLVVFLIFFIAMPYIFTYTYLPLKISKNKMNMKTN